MDVNNKEFVLKNVLILPFFWFPFGGLVIGMPLFIIYGTYGFRYLGVWGLVFTAMIFFAILSLLIKYLSKNITIRFLPEKIDININGRSTIYNKKDIIGIFAHDYHHTSTSLISIQINFKSGKKIEIVDSIFTEKYDLDVCGNLRKLMTAFEREIGFVKLNKNRMRSFQKLGAYWYSKVQ